MTGTAPHPIPAVLKVLYQQQAALKEAFPNHPFGLDGNLIGDMGEVIAEKAFGLVKLKSNSKTHDMERPDDGALVQVKATQKAAAGKPVGLGVSKRSFDFLLVFELAKDGTFEVLYNGPGDIIDHKRSHKKSASLSRNQLRECQVLVKDAQQLKPVKDFIRTQLQPSGRI